MTEKRQFPGVHVHVSPGSAETLARRGGTTNNCSIAYALSNIFARSSQHWLMCVEVIVCNVSVVFLRHSVLHVQRNNKLSRRTVHDNRSQRSDFGTPAQPFITS